MDNIYIDRVLGGDSEAFRYLMEQYREMAWQLAISILREESLAADAVQESFFLAYRKLGSFQRRSKFSTWLARIVINEALKLQKQPQRQHSEIEKYASVETSAVPGGLDLLTAGERKYYLQKAMDALSYRESLALKLFYLQEFSLAEVREATGWTEANVKVILHRARRHLHIRLKQLLKEEIREIY